jgi:hypothetical protein
VRWKVREWGGRKSRKKTDVRGLRGWLEVEEEDRQARPICKRAKKIF